MRCEGYTKPGMFQFAPQFWEQCSKEGVVKIRFIQEEESEKTLPACKECWQRIIDSKSIEILEVLPI